MLAKVYSYGINGLDAYPVTIEIDVARGLPSTIIVGLPDNAVRESKERVRSAIKNSGYDFGSGRITINLSPADVKKEGPSFDLAIALGILAATHQINTNHLNEYAILGELSLDGRIQPVIGTLSAALAITKTRFKGLILPSANASEAAIAEHASIYPVNNLKQIVQFLNEPDTLEPFKLNISALFQKTCHHDVDFSIQGERIPSVSRCIANGRKKRLA